MVLGKKPEELVEERLQVSVTFRLTEADAARLHALAKRAGVGHATLCRRIVEEYVREHAPRRARRKRR